MMTCRMLMVTLGLLAGLGAFAQKKSADLDLTDIEEILELDEGQEDFDFDNIREDLEYFLGSPLDINAATVEDLRALGILSELQIQNIVAHRQYAGDFISMIELQAVPGIGVPVAKLLASICEVRGNSGTVAPLGKRLTEGDRLLFLRWTRNLQDQRGFLPNSEGKTPFEGDANKLYMRFLHRHGNNLSYGLTAEKDAGEAFFRASNRQGFDYYSGHLWWKTPDAKLKQVALGDYTLSFGEGLVMHSDFGYGKSGFIKDVKKSFRKMRSYRSVSESNFLRGGALQYALSDRLELTAFGSYRRRDANVVEPDSLDQEDRFVSSLQLSGLHRTATEIEDEGSLGLLTAGAHLSYEAGRVTVGATGMTNRFDRELRRGDAPYLLFEFGGSEVHHLGLNYNIHLGSVNVFGEVAQSMPGGRAIATGVLSSLSTKLDAAVFYRKYDPDYVSLWSNGLGETSRTNNEEGIYAGLEFRPDYGWLVQAYVDLWKHRWARFRIDAPSTGSEYYFKIGYRKKRQWEVYCRYRSETKYRTENLDGITIDRIYATLRSQLRFNVDYNVTPSLRLRNRIDFSWWRVDQIEEENGFLIYQDIIFKPVGSKISATARYALFDTDGWDSRLYAFENDLIYNFSIPPYSGRGRRYYLNLRYKMSSLVTLEARYSEWNYSDRTFISAGNNRIDSNRRSEAKVQMRLSF